MRFHPVFFIAALVAVEIAKVSSQFCNSCEECSQEISQPALCKCDSECGLYGDCCSTIDDTRLCPSPHTTLLQPGATVECRSAFLNPDITVSHLNEAFIMVISCPDFSPTVMRSNCSDPVVNLPPVTDRSTGLVYRNEFCAICNGVTDFQAWDLNIGCTDSVYKLLLEKSIASILQDTLFKDIFKTNCNGCSYNAPASLMGIHLPRPCIPMVSSCLSKLDLEETTEKKLSESSYLLMVESCRLGGLDPVTSISDSVYRNTNCAHCNAVEDIECHMGLMNSSRGVIDECLPTGVSPTNPPPISVPPLNLLPLPSGSGITPTIDITPTDVPPQKPEPLIPVPSFTITLSNLGGGQVLISTESDAAQMVVDCPEGQAPVGLECRDTLCPEGYTQTGGRCAFAVDTSDISEVSEVSVELGSAEDMSDNSSSRPEFLDCPTGLLALENSDFQDRGNGTIFYDGELVEVLFYDNDSRPLICPDNTSLIVTNRTVISLLPGISELSYVGCSLSVMGTVLILLTYRLFSQLRTFPSMLLMNLSFALLITNLLFVIGGPIVQHFPNVQLCTITAIFLHFFNLAQFSWMSLFSIEMACNFYAAKKLVPTVKKNKRRSLALYMLVGWGVPVGICVITIALNYSGRGLILYGVTSEGRVGNCWINHFLSFILSFLVPLVISLTVNLGMFVVVSVLLCQAAKNKSKLQNKNSSLLVRVWIAMFFITGFTWVFGFIAIPDEISWAWYPFVIFNSTQGFNIFLAFLCTKKVLKMYKKCLTRKKNKSTKKAKASNLSNSLKAQESKLSAVTDQESIVIINPTNWIDSEDKETAL